MFTGIVEELGVVSKIQKKKNLFVLAVKAHKASKGTSIGESISVDGVCLTVTNCSTSTLIFDIMRETINRTTLKYLRPTQRINLERSLKTNDRLSGHFVLGHVDCVGTIRKRIVKTNYVEFKIKIAKGLMRYIVPKGSICVDGISLTVGKVWNDIFSVYIIPHTLKITTLGRKETSDKVNIETDILAKYILRQR